MSISFWRARTAARATVCALVGTALLHAPAVGQEAPTEAGIKAALVANIPLFIAFPNAGGPLRLCIAGRGKSADAVRALDTRQIKGRAVEAVALASPAAVAGRGCDLLFVAASTGARAVEYAQASAGNATVIVSEDDVLSLDHSHIVLALDERSPVLEINLTAVRKLNLDISARLLKVARRVK